jgi:hypothetical protein
MCDHISPFILLDSLDGLISSNIKLGLKGVRATYEKEIADMAKTLETQLILSSQFSRDSAIDNLAY